MTTTTSEPNYDPETTCRCCLAMGLPMKPLFGHSLDEMLKSIAQVDVSKDDGLPAAVCQQCLLQVSRSFRFREQCRSSDMKLRKVFQSDTAACSQSELVDGIIKEIEMVAGRECAVKNEFFEWIEEQQNCSGGVGVGTANDQHSVDLLLFDEHSTTEAIVSVAEKPAQPLPFARTKPAKPCKICGKEFSETKKLTRHMRTHNPEKPFRCDKCEMSFCESSNLTKHLKTHTGELRNQKRCILCSVCGKGFKWSSSLYKHMRHHTKNKILTCPHCPKEFVERQSLEIHLRNHTGEKPFACSHCDKAFAQRANLVKHLRVHTGEKPYKCDFCEKRFAQKSFCVVHMRGHTGEKPFKCEECGMTFAALNYLSAHKRTHTGEKPYACGLHDCDKTFARLETAITHRRTHTGEKPFECEQCDQRFTTSSQLKTHAQSHKEAETFSCSVCQKSFSKQQSLKAHLKSEACGREKDTSDALFDDLISEKLTIN